MNSETNIEQYLKEKGTLTYTFKGSSMRPLLRQGRDLYTLASKSSDRCKKYDIVLYRNAQKGKYVLHRIVEVRDDDYVILGDNCISKEYGVRDEDIIGVVTSINRNGKNIDVSDLKYRIYTHIWVQAVHPIIRCIIRIVKKPMVAIRKYIKLQRGVRE